MKFWVVSLVDLTQMKKKIGELKDGSVKTFQIEMQRKTKTEHPRTVEQFERCEMHVIEDKRKCSDIKHNNGSMSTDTGPN